MMKNRISGLPTLAKAEISQRLSGTPSDKIISPFPKGFFNEDPYPAGILIPFTCINERWHLLFIRRTKNGYDRHGGQVAFPGGRMDPDDLSIEVTALREAHEEVGLKPEDIEIMGKLHDFHSITNYRVTPVVGCFSSPYPLQINPKEVSRVFTIPLEWLADASNHQTVFRHFPQNRPWPIIYFDPFEGEALWGFTAQVVVQLLKVLQVGNFSSG